MKLDSVLLVAALTCALGSVAEAQSSDDSLNVHHVYLPSDGRGFYALNGARTLAHGEVHLSLDYSHAHNPLELGLPGDRRAVSLTRQLTMLDAGIAVGLGDSLSLHAVLPVVLDHDGRELDRPSDVRSGGVGAARFELKINVYDSRGDLPERRPARDESVAFALSVHHFLTLPTGRRRDYLNDNGNPTGGSQLLAELELFQRLRLGANLGYEFVSSDIDFQDLSIRDRIRFGAAVEVFLLRESAPPAEADEPGDEAQREGEDGDHDEATREGEPGEDNPHTLALGGELFGWADAGRPFHDERERPIEGLLYLRYRHRIGLQVRLGWGGGLTNGVGAPDYRYVAGLGWTF